ncbi:Crp/Fnr family transcriptional regulator [Streptomyces sp. NPDC001904]|uniref:Crp/Fnr family transcriptional regulator n=1 Tax=Streptomyces sp. NPDC001904 TaxID=3154531 RepID=UPI00331A013B
MTNVAFWNTLDADEREIMRKGGREPQRPYRPGDQILRQGDDRPDRAALIITGRCRVLWDSGHGHTTYLATRGDGDLIGEMAVLDGGSRNGTVRALTETYVRWYAREAFEEMLTQHPGIMRKLLTSVSGRLKESDQQQIALASASPDIRIARLLLRLADAEGVPHDGGVQITGVTRQDLGNWTGMGRDAATRCVVRLQKLSLLGTISSRGRVLILDREGLRRHATRPSDG